jgi:DNA-binding response OmpR family regulator
MNEYDGSVPAKILLIEDDPNLSMVIRDYLELHKFKVWLCQDGSQGLKVFRENKFDLVILDIMLPRKDGYTLAKDIRKLSDIPIVFLTAKSLPEDRIKGFQTGCDDYMTKPFHTEELILRIKAILKRSQQIKAQVEEVPPVIKIGMFTFDYENMVLQSEKGTQTLTRKECALLRVLAVNKNRLLPREVALRNVWGNDDYFIGRSMDVFISKLRRYLKDDPSISITNVHGIGFKLEVKE